MYDHVRVNVSFKVLLTIIGTCEAQVHHVEHPLKQWIK